MENGRERGEERGGGGERKEERSGRRERKGRREGEGGGETEGEQKGKGRRKERGEEVEGVGREGIRRGEEGGELNNALQWILNCNYKVILTCIFPHLVLSDDGLQWRLWKHLPVAEQVDTRQ